MEKKNEVNPKEYNNCVVHDDTHGWGGAESTYEIIEPKIPLRDLVKEEKPSEIRFIVDKKNKEVYVFGSDLLHDEAAKKTLKKRTSGMADRYIHGIADKKGNII